MKTATSDTKRNVDLIAGAMAAEAGARGLDPEAPDLPTSLIVCGPLPGGHEPVVRQGHAGHSIRAAGVAVATAVAS